MIIKQINGSEKWPKSRIIMHAFKQNMMTTMNIKTLQQSLSTPLLKQPYKNEYNFQTKVPLYITCS